MNASRDCYVLTRHYEKCRLQAYPDPASPLARARARSQSTNGLSGHPWTIGWGHTGPEVKEGLVWTLDHANDVHKEDMSRFERDVTFLLSGKEVPQCQFDALVSFAYNVGSDIDIDKIAEGLGDSTLLKKVLADDEHGAAAEFLKWNRAQGQVMWGLVRRRYAERCLFLGLPVEDAIARGDAQPRP